MNSDLVEMLRRHEGFRSKPYRCSAGKITIGYGRNIEDIGISKCEATILLFEDIDRATKDIKSVFPSFNDFSANRQNALIDMMFNLGAKRFRSFKKMIRAIERNNWGEATRQTKDSKWYKQVGIRAIEIGELLRDG